MKQSWFNIKYYKAVNNTTSEIHSPTNNKAEKTHALKHGKCNCNSFIQNYTIIPPKLINYIINNQANIFQLLTLSTNLASWKTKPKF